MTEEYHLCGAPITAGGACTNPDCGAAWAAFNQHGSGEDNHAHGDRAW
jgi:hypothetical protein